MERVNMKVKGFFLADLFSLLWPENFAHANLTPEGDGTLTTRKKVTKNSKPKKQKKLKTDFEDAIDRLIEFRRLKGAPPPTPNFKYEQLQLMLAGSFDTAYWKSCRQDSKVIIETMPGIGEFQGVRNYSYPDASNAPSSAIYADGVVSSGDPAYYGLTENGVFHDDALKWARYVFTLANKCLADDGEPLFLTVNGTIMAESDVRPCRAMLSMIIKRHIVGASSAKLTSLASPTDKPIQAQYMYKMPSTGGAGFFIEWTKKLVYSLRSKIYEDQGVDLVKLVCLVAPMPMMGHKYNNNTDILTSISNLTVKAWQIKKSREWSTCVFDQSVTWIPWNIGGGVLGSAGETWIAINQYWTGQPMSWAVSHDGITFTEHKETAPVISDAGGGETLRADSALRIANNVAATINCYSTGYLYGVASTSDAANWAVNTSGDFSYYMWNTLVVANGVFYAFSKTADYPTVVKRSANGVDWDAAFEINTWQISVVATEIIAVNGVLFALPTNYQYFRYFYTSTDGHEWSEHYLGGGVEKFAGVTYLNGVYTIWSASANGYKYTSSDLSAWTQGLGYTYLRRAISTDTFICLLLSVYPWCWVSENGEDWETPDGSSSVLSNMASFSVVHDTIHITVVNDNHIYRLGV
jgi:hypothetical protein